MSSSAPAGGGTPLADMSLSKRFLSLPQELAGASLPPQVSGKRCGSVALCVPHILESAVSSRPLPRVALVRVRWWGEQAPGSLFRPSLLSGDAAAAEEDAPQRAIAVKYPVTVQPEQLVEYFHDMRHLTLDVIDRDSRKKVGESRLSLELERDNAEMTAEEKLVALRRENALCEIKPSDEAGEQDEVLGYLAVSFDVQWTDETKVKGRGQVQAEIEMESQEDVDELSSASSTSLPSNREWTAVVDTEKEARRPVVMVGPRQGERKEEGVNMERKTREESVQSRMPSEDSQRIQRLLLKGKALRQSMERAVKDKENDNREELDVVDIGGQGGGYLNVPDELDGEQKADEHDPYTEFTNTTGTLDEAFALKSGPIAKMQNKMTAQLNGGVDSSFLDQFNALTLTFQSLELERDFVAHQLHHLRDSSSVSSRFSPIEIRVSHDHVATLLYRNANKTDFPEVSAFSVTTSLRRRHWQLECRSSMALTPPSFLPEGGTSTASKCDGTKPLRFLVRCENQSDARRSKKREAKNLFPRPSKCILLQGVLPGTALFDTERDNRDRPTWVPLFIVGDPDGVDSKKVAYGDHRGARMNRLPRTKKPQPVGYLKVKYEFCDLTPSNSLSESGGVSDAKDGAEDFDFSSVSSSPSERLSQKDQVGLSNARELLVGKQELAPKFGGSGLFQLGVMIDCVSNVNVFESPSDRSPLARGDRAQSTASHGGSRGNDAVASREAASVSLHYSVPSVFTRRSAPSIKFERTAKRKLRCSDFSASLSADFMGSIHAFQSLFADDASDYFSSGYLIIEAWLHTADAESTLLGLSKVPLSEFAGFVRSKEVDLLGFSKKTLPAASVDGKFAIENPFTGRVMGYLQVRVCVGTAEQLLAWASAIRAIVRLQGVARGALCRKRLGAFRGSRCLRTKQESREPAADSWSVVQSTADSRCSDSVSTAPTLDTARVNFVDRCNQDERMEQRLENLSENSDVVESDLGDRERRVALRKVCFNIRESWRSAILHEGHMGSTHHQRGMKSSPPLGCELQGHLVLTGDTRYQTGIPFALWWDAVDQNLNSCFVHTFRGSQLNHHLPLLGPQSQVLFSFQVEHGFFGTQSRQVTTGEARLHLYQAVGKRANVAESTMRRSMGDAASVSVDIPIEWDSGDDESQQLPTVLPLKISYSTVPLSTLERTIGGDGTVFSDCFGSVEHVGDSTSTEAKNFMADFETNGLSRTADTAVGIANQSADVGLDPINSDNVSRNGEDSVDALTVSSVPADNLNPICESHQKDTTASADDARSYSGESDGSSLELTDDFFKPVTLTSFGIEEMELSPLGVDEELPEKYAVASPAAIPPQTSGGLDRSGVSVDAVSGDESPQTVISAKEEQVQAGGKTTPDSTRSPCPEFDDGTSTNDAHNWAAVSEEVTIVSGIVAADSTGDMADDPSAFDAAHNDCAESSSLEDNVGNSIDTERRPECIAAILAQTVEYADKSAQVGFSELNIWAPAVNESPRSVNGDDVCADTPGSDEAQKGAAGEGSTVDVACDAMPMTSISIVGGSETQYEAEVASQNSCVEAGEESEDMDLLDDSRSDFSDDDADSPDSVYGSNESSTKSSRGHPEQRVPCIEEHESAYESPQKEKLELVYEMLCEMRDSHAAKSLERPAASADIDTERLPGRIPSSPACTVDYADKCVQTDLCELAQAVNESPPSVGGDDVCADTPWSDEPQVTAGGERSTVDVGCDAMQVATVSIAVGSEAAFEEEAPADNGDVEVGKDSDDMEMDDDLNSVIADGIGDSADSIDDEKEGRVPPPESSLVSPEQLAIDSERADESSPPPAVQNEKLELMYEMLREMRDLYAAKLLEKPPAPAEDVRCHKEDLEGDIGTLSPKASFASPEIKDSGDKACACSTPTSPRGPISPKTKGLILDKSIAPDIPSSIGLRQQEFAHTSRVISPLLRPEQNFKSKIIRRDMSSAQDALGSSLGVSGKVDHRRVSSNRGWLSSSDITWGKKAQFSRQAPEKDDRHLSAHSLFAHDSETERIARIMQGSMKYWMKDDSSCSGGDRESDEEETDDDCYF